MKNWKNIVQSANLRESDSEDVNYTDHEVSMAKSQLLSSVKSSTRIAKHLSDKSEDEGIPGWVASKLTVAEDYLQAVADYMDGEELQEGYKVMPPMDPKYVERKGLEGPFTTLSGKVVYYDPKEGSYYDPDTDMYISYDEFQDYDKDYSGMKNDNNEVEEGNEFSGALANAKKSGKKEFNVGGKTYKVKEVVEAEAENDTKYGIVRYPDTAISYIKNDGNGWEHIFDKSYGFEGPVDKEDLQYAKKIAKEKIPSRMFEATDTCECGCNCGKDVCESCGKKHSVKEDTVKYEDHEDDRVILTVEKDKLLYNGNPIQNYDWNSSAKHIISDKFYGRAKSWKEVHQYLVRFLDNPKGLQSAVRQVFNTNDEGIQVNETVMFSEAQFDEAAGEKDACYRKVKSRYKVWPSAYASGALVKCRKVGAANWGNSKK
jgi:hypothetical protein